MPPFFVMVFLLPSYSVQGALLSLFAKPKGLLRLIYFFISGCIIKYRVVQIIQYAVKPNYSCCQYC
ncbi:MAG: hypothetical protein ACI9SK_001573 [Zhongshania sp.]|jgi:hypothetical protein